MHYEEVCFILADSPARPVFVLQQIRLQMILQQQSFHPTAVQPRLLCVSETTRGAFTLQAAQAGLKTQLQVLAGKAVELRWQKLAAQMVAQLELTQPQVRAECPSVYMNESYYTKTVFCFVRLRIVLAFC